MSAKFHVTPIDLYVSPKEFSDLLGISVQALYKFCREKGIDTKVENGRSHKITPEQARQIAELRGLSYPRLNINVHNVKGGVGKTTTVHVLASRAAMLGFKVLVVDLDQQGNCSRSFGVFGSPKDYKTMLELYEHHKSNKTGMTAKDLVKELHPHLHLIPSNLSMANMDMVMTLDSSMNSKEFFRDMLEGLLDNYDLIVLDSPPALSTLTASAHAFSDIVLLPINPDEYSVDAINLNFNHLQRLVRNQRLEIQPMIFVNKYDSRPKIDFKIVSEIHQGDFGQFMCEAAVRQTSTIKAEFEKGKTLWDLAKGSPALDDFNNLLLEVTGLREIWAELSEKVKEAKKGDLPLVQATPNRTSTPDGNPAAL